MTRESKRPAARQSGRPAKEYQNDDLTLLILSADSSNSLAALRIAMRFGMSLSVAHLVTNLAGMGAARG